MLEEIIQNGNRSYTYFGPNTIYCADGFTVSVVAGEFVYSSPRTFGGPYTLVEVGFPSERPEPWEVWNKYVENEENPTETVYAFVPVEIVRSLIALHGGEI